MRLHLQGRLPACRQLRCQINSQQNQCLLVNLTQKIASRLAALHLLNTIIVTRSLPHLSLLVAYRNADFPQRFGSLSYIPIGCCPISPLFVLYSQRQSHMAASIHGWRSVA
jgi:hypothetical protein